jgi:hypothetical protein
MTAPGRHRHATSADTPANAVTTTAGEAIASALASTHAEPRTTTTAHDASAAAG